MGYKLKRYRKPANLLMICGFTFAMADVLLGISSISKIMEYAAGSDDEMPIYHTIADSGFSIMILIYLFSITNCLAVVWYKMIAEKRTFAIKKAFGASNGLILREISFQMTMDLCLSLLLGYMMVLILTKSLPMYFSFRISPWFFGGTFLMFILTLAVAMIIPVVRVMKIYPAEVVK